MKHLISLLIFLLFSWLALWWYYSCDWCLGSKNQDPAIVNQQIDPEAEALAKKAYEDSVANANRMANFLFAKDDTDAEIFKYNDNFWINSSNGDVNIPDELSNFSEKITTYLGNHQDKELVISGFETTAEKQTGGTFGLDRANFIKNLLIDKGINGDKIVTQAVEKEYAYQDDGRYHGGVLLNFKTLDNTRLAEVEEGIAHKTLYSRFGVKEFKADATLANYTLELKNYLEKYPNKKVLITGHTDNIGSTSSNQRFGLKRARNVREYLISKGISAEKLKASSKGEKAPAYPNDSKENRAKNRRIEINVN